MPFLTETQVKCSSKASRSWRGESIGEAYERESRTWRIQRVHSLDIKWLDEYFITKLTLSELAAGTTGWCLLFFLAGKGYTFVVVLQDSNVLPASKDQNELAGGPLPSHSSRKSEPVCFRSLSNEPSPSTENEEMIVALGQSIELKENAAA